MYPPCPLVGHRGRGYVATLPTSGPPLILPPRSEAVGTPPGGRGYVATLPTCGPPRQGVCSHLAQLWATSDSAARPEVVGTPQAAGLCSHLAHLWATAAGGM